MNTDKTSPKSINKIQQTLKFVSNKLLSEHILVQHYQITTSRFFLLKWNYTIFEFLVINGLTMKTTNSLLSLMK